MRTVYGELEFHPKVNVYSSFSRTMVLPATVLKRVYLWNWNSYEAGSGLILEVINCTLTWDNKQEIDGQREVVPFLRSYHILKNFGSLVEYSVCTFNNSSHSIWGSPPVVFGPSYNM